MPHINRIRVNNIKYNVGTQFYDDLCLGFKGKTAFMIWQMEGERVF